MSPKKTTKKQEKLTRKDILRMIEKNGGPEGLSLSGKDLSGIDLGYAAIAEELKDWQASHPGENPVWYSPETQGINLHKTNLGGANLQEAYLWRANLQEADLGEANLQEANLWEANLQEAKLGGANLQEAVLLRANLQEAYFTEANLQRARMYNAKLERVDLTAASNLEGVFWQDAILDRTRMPEWKKLIPIGEEVARQWEEAKEAYLLLKDNYNDLGQYDYARECYIKEREMERKDHKQNKRWWPWLWLTLFRSTSTYGQNPVAVFLWTIGWVVLFAAIYAYFLTGGISIAPDQWTEWWPVLYSMASFATLEFSGFEALSPFAKLATSLESILGIFWLAYFVYALANRTRSF